MPFVRNVTPRHDDAAPERDDGLDRRAGPAIPRDDEGLTVEWFAVPEAEHDLLGWLVQEVAHEPHIVGDHQLMLRSFERIGRTVKPQIRLL